MIGVPSILVGGAAIATAPAVQRSVEAKEEIAAATRRAAEARRRVPAAPSLPPTALPSPWSLGELAAVGIGAAPRRRSRWWGPAEEPFVPPLPPVLPAALNMLTLDERARLLLLRRHRSRAVRTFMERSLGC